MGDTSTWKLKHRERLFQAVADGVCLLEGREKLASIEVVFLVGDIEYVIGGVGAALDVLANDIYWDERGDWSDADRAIVRVI